MKVEVDPVSGVKMIGLIGLLASLVGGVAQSILWFGVGAGLLLGVALQIAAAIVAAYLVITTIPEFHPARHDHAAPGGATGGARRGPWVDAAGLASV
jgi:hypothetical protein